MSALYFQVTYCSNGPKTINSNISTISVILDLASSEDHGRNSSHSLSVSLFLVLLKCCSKNDRLLAKFSEILTTGQPTVCLLIFL